jgi:hypothetical protein
VVKLDGGGVLAGIGGVDAVDLRGLEQDFRVDFVGAQGGRRIGREEGVAGAAGEDDRPAALKMADGAPADVGLGDLAHVDGAHHTRRQPRFFDRVLQRQRIDKGGDHADVIADGPLHFGRVGAAEDIAAADDDPHFHTEQGHFLHLGGEAADDDRIDAVIAIALEELAAEFEENAAVLRLGRIGHAAGETSCGTGNSAKARIVPALKIAPPPASSSSIGYQARKRAGRTGRSGPAFSSRSNPAEAQRPIFSRTKRSMAIVSPSFLPTPSISFWIVISGSFTKACSSRQICEYHLLIFPATILSKMFSGLPSLRACSR